MKKYIKPELTVREIRVSENLAAKIDLWDDAVWTQFDMLSIASSPASTSLDPVEVEA